jgi:hypothetical protein
LNTVSRLKATVVTVEATIKGKVSRAMAGRMAGLSLSSPVVVNSVWWQWSIVVGCS